MGEYRNQAYLKAGAGIALSCPSIQEENVGDDRALTIATDSQASRAALVEEVAAGLERDDGQIIWANGVAYKWQAGATVIPDLLGLVPSGYWTPLHFGCAGDGTTDDGTEFNIALAAYKTAIETDTNLNGGIIFDGLGLIYASSIPLNQSGYTSFGWKFQNFTILSSAAGKTAWYMVASRGGTLEEVRIEGVEANMPYVGFQQARGASGDDAFCDHIKFDSCRTAGYFELAGIYAYGAESNTHINCEWWNEHVDGHTAILEGRLAYPIESESGNPAFVQPISSQTSFINNTYIRTDFRSVPTGRIAYITDVIEANPLQVEVATPSLFEVGDEIVFRDPPDAILDGARELLAIKATITDITGDLLTFNATNASGYSAWISGGQAVKAQSKSTLLFGRGNGHHFDSCYFVNYGSDNIEIDLTSTVTLKSITFKNALFEGGGSRSNIRFTNVGADTRTLHDFHVSTWDANARTSYVSSDATTGFVQLYGSSLHFPSEVSEGTPLLLDDPANFTLYGFEGTSYRDDVLDESTLNDLTGKIYDINAGNETHYGFRAGSHTYQVEVTAAQNLDHYWVDSSGNTVGYHRFSNTGDSWVLSLNGSTNNYAWVPTGFYPTVDVTSSLGLSNRRWTQVYANGLALQDGITAPATITGHAVIYVDAADGDLKVKFSDGTVKTIVVDT